MRREMRAPWLWTNATVVLLGLWLLFAPAMLGSSGMAANSDRLVGAAVLTVAAVSAAEVIRTFRLVNLLFAIGLMVGPWAVTGITPGARWNDVVAGVALFALTLPRGAIRERYAGWDRLIL